MSMSEEESKLATSAAMGVLGFLASRIYDLLAKRGEKQDGLSTNYRVMEVQLERLEKDVQELKAALATHTRDQRADREVIGERLHMLFNKLIELASLAERAGWTISDDWDLPKKRRNHDDER